VAAAAAAHDIAAGILAKDREAADRYAELGYRLLAVGSDAGFLMEGARRVVTAVRD
jgi:2-keto-3-deoxy-L-rhamnonate aldolase RhmA